MFDSPCLVFNVSSLVLVSFVLGGCGESDERRVGRKSWGPQGEALVVASVAAVVVGTEGQDAVLLVGDPAPDVGDIDDVQELLGDVGGNDDGSLGSLSLLSSEDRGGALLGGGRGREVVVGWCGCAVLFQPCRTGYLFERRELMLQVPELPV